MHIFWREVKYERMRLNNRENSLLVLLWQRTEMNSAQISLSSGLKVLLMRMSTEEESQTQTPSFARLTLVCALSDLR